MILIADSGSSKTDWRLIDGDSIKQFNCRGLNPDFVNSQVVFEAVNLLFSNTEKMKVSKLFFYGSGCSSFLRNKIVEDGLSMVFPNATIVIDHDLLGAARAACGREKGVAAILGTGSNCCLFDGTSVVKKYDSGGFIIGDEGGGVHLGKKLIKSFIEDRLPKDLRERFNHRYGLSIDQILESLYKKEQPNRFLASFSRFVFQHREHSFISNLIQDSFESFFEQQVLRFEESKSLPLNLVGSIAFYYHEYLRKVAKNHDIQIGNILEKPISGLTLFHQTTRVH